MMTKFTKLLLVTALFAPSTLLAKSETIQRLLNTYVKQNYTTGIAVAIILPNKRVDFYSAGKMTRSQRGHPITQNTIFPIASITKVFTALALANEAIHGEVDLNKPAQLCMPDKIRLPIYHHDYPIKPINLITHTASLASTPGQLTQRSPYKHVSLSSIARYLKYDRLIYPPGSRYLYSDLSITLAGICVSTTAKMPYKEYVEEKILRPLKLKSTLFSIPWYRKPDLVTGYKADGKKADYWRFGAMAAAGGLYSTARDLAVFVRTNMGIEKTPLYPAMLLTHRGIFPQGKNARNAGLPKDASVQSAMGWNVYGKLVWKTGNYPGFSSFIGFRADKKVGVVVLANTSNILYINNLALHLLDSNFKLMPRHTPVKIKQSALKGLAGRYQIKGGDLYKVETKDRHLLISNLSAPLRMRNSFNVYPLGSDRFFGRVDNAIFVFQRNENKEITGFRLVEDGQTAIAQKKNSRFDGCKHSSNKLPNYWWMNLGPSTLHLN